MYNNLNMHNEGGSMYSLRTHKKKFSINGGNAFIFILQVQFSTVILHSRRMNLN